MSLTLAEARAAAQALAAPPDALLAAVVAAATAARGAPLTLWLGGEPPAGTVPAKGSALSLEHCLAALALGARGLRLAAVPEDMAGAAARAVVADAVALLAAIGIAPAPVTVDAAPSLPRLAPLAGFDLARPRGLRLRALLEHLARAAGWEGLDPLPLPPGSPAGNLAVSSACTLCMACVPDCPTRALSRDGATLVLDAAACVQCGLCVSICPEQAVTPLPGLFPASPPMVVAQDEPAICPNCGAAFGSQRSLAQVRARLAETGWADQNPALAAKLARCEDCRALP